MRKKLEPLEAFTEGMEYLEKAYDYLSPLGNLQGCPELEKLIENVSDAEWYITKYEKKIREFLEGKENLSYLRTMIKALENRSTE